MDDVEEFKESLSYLHDWINYSKKSIVSSLKELCEEDLILKEDYYINKIKYCKYRVNLDKIK